MANMTVTLTLDGSFPIALMVKVLTGASGIGRTASGWNKPTEMSITPQGSGSIIFGGCALGPASYPYPANANSTKLSDASTASQGREYPTFRTSGPTTAGLPVTVGLTAQGNLDNSCIALCEILSGGSLAIDASSPAPVPADGSGNLPSQLSVTTAQFDPPPGSTLVAVGVTAGNTRTITDSRSLAWTQQVYYAGGGYGNVTVWSAQVPGPSSFTGSGGITLKKAAIHGTDITLGHLEIGTGRAPYLEASGGLAYGGECSGRVIEYGELLPPEIFG